MEKQRSIKVLSVIALVVAVLGLTVAFAAFQQTLNITGTGSVKGNTQDGDSTWDIHFENLSKTESGLAKVTQEATIDSNGTSIGEYSVSLSAPGDSVVYTFNVVNDGMLNATLSSLTELKPVCTGIATEAENKTADENQVCNGLTYTLTYDDGTDVKSNDTLLKGETKTMKLTLSYSYEGERKISNDVNISNLNVALIYKQQQ